MKISIVLGTRPEIIKFSPIIRECERLVLDYFILHTGQHYSYNMDEVFFEQLDLPRTRHNLDVGSGSHAEQTGRMLISIERVARTTRKLHHTLSMYILLRAYQPVYWLLSETVLRTLLGPFCQRSPLGNR
jgi:hypothetical protein